MARRDCDVVLQAVVSQQEHERPLMKPPLAGAWPAHATPARCARQVQSSRQPASLQPPGRLGYAAPHTFYDLTRTALAGQASIRVHLGAVAGRHHEDDGGACHRRCDP